MALWRATSPSAKAPSDALVGALCAAELGEPYDLVHLPIDALRELFSSTAQLRESVPYATMSLLARLACDPRLEVRTQVALALADFVTTYPDRVDELLRLLSCDSARRVRHAASMTLAVLLPRVPDPERIIADWENARADRAREAMAAARRSLPPPLGI
jgi:hypothetical protein